MSWSTVPLRRVALVEAGQSPLGDAVADSEVGLPFLQGNAEFGAFCPTPNRWCANPPKVCQPGDVLISVRAPVGAINAADREYGIGRGLAAIRPRKVNPRFLWWSLHASVVALRSVATGSTYEAVTAEDLGSLRIPLVEEREQRAIADFLDAETNRIDSLAALIRNRSDLAFERVTAARASWVLQGLNPMSGTGCSDPWPISKLGIIVALQRGHDLPHEARRYGSVPVVSSGGISGRHDMAVCQPPGVVTGRYGTIGEVFLINEPYWPLNTTLYVSDFKGNWASWIRHLLLALPLDAESEKSAVGGIDRKVVGDLRVPVPSFEEQRSTASRLDALEVAAQRITSSLHRQIELFRERKQALITAAVTGQLDLARDIAEEAS